jgi:hypothetical protein
MKLPPEKKPSLSDLFNSKKLDVPSNDFWDNFQDQVRCKTLSSLVSDNNQTGYFKYISYATALFVFSCFSYWVFFLPESLVVTIAENSDDLNLNSLALSDEKILKSSSRPDIVASIDREIFLTESEDFFVEQNYLASSLESSFQHRILEDDHDYLDDSVQEFTF